MCDEFMRQAIQRELPPHVESVALSYRKPIPEGLGAIFLGGGTLIGCGLSRLHTYLDNHDTPLCIIGCGFREWQQKRDWELFWDTASHIAVRGYYTRIKCEEVGLDTGKINCIGDPIFLYENEHMEKERYLGVAQRKKEAWYIDNWLPHMEFLTGFPAKKVGFSKGQKDIADKFKDIDGTYEDVCKASWWFGNRLHAFALATINNIPALPVEIEYNKVYDICSSIGYPYWVKMDEDPTEVFCKMTAGWSDNMKYTQQRIGEIRDSLKSFIGDFIQQ